MLAVRALAATGLLAALGSPLPARALECEGVGCCPEGVTPVVGTAASETLRGTRGPDCLLGEGGNDKVLVRNGDDVGLGGPGDDILQGLRDANWLAGEEGNDLLLGGRHDDHLDGGTGDDRAYGRTGDDTIHGGPDDDVATGGPGEDHIHGGPGTDLLFGDQDDDWIRGGPDDDLVVGGPGDDRLNGGPGRDWIFAGSGNDTILIDEACEAVAGEQVHGGPGTDTVESPLKEAQLLELGFLFFGVEQFVEVEAPPDPSCQLPPPRAAGQGGLCSLMQESAALLEGTVSDLDETFDEQEGPREVVTLEDEVVHLGSTGLPLGTPIRLRILRGTVPTIVDPETDEPARLEVSHTPVFHEGERYLIPLRGTHWNDSPVVYPYYYRIVDLAGKTVVVDDDGYPLTRIYGARLETQVFEPTTIGSDIVQLVDPSEEEIAPALGLDEFVAGWVHVAGNCEDAFSGKFSPFPDQRRQWDRTRVVPSGGGGILPPCIGGAVDPETGEELVCDE